MAARTPIAAGYAALSGQDTGVVFPNVGQTPDAVNGNTVPAGPTAAIIIVKNADASSHTMTVRAGGSGVTATGAAAAPVAFEPASTGDLVVTVAAGTSQIVQLETTARFMQADGSLSLDFSSSTSVTVWVISRYYNPI